MTSLRPSSARRRRARAAGVAAAALTVVAITAAASSATGPSPDAAPPIGRNVVSVVVCVKTMCWPTSARATDQTLVRTAGNVSTERRGIDCGGPPKDDPNQPPKRCQWFARAGLIRLKATATEDPYFGQYEFSEWKGACKGKLPDQCQVVVKNKFVEVRAIFVSKQT